MKARVPNSGARAVLSLSGNPDCGERARPPVSGWRPGPRRKPQVHSALSGPSNWPWAPWGMGMGSPRISRVVLPQFFTQGTQKMIELWLPQAPAALRWVGRGPCCPPKERAGASSATTGLWAPHPWPHHFASPGCFHKEEARGSIPMTIFPLGPNFGPEAGWPPHWLVRPMSQDPHSTLCYLSLRGWQEAP